MPLDPDTIASALESAPAWALLAMTVPSERLRQDARHEVAQHLVAALTHPVERDQLALPL